MKALVVGQWGGGSGRGLGGIGAKVVTQEGGGRRWMQLAVAAKAGLRLRERWEHFVAAKQGSVGGRH